MKFKVAISIISAAAALGMSVQAADVRTEVKGTSVTVTAFTKGDAKANIFVSRKDGDVNDNNSVYEIVQVTADKDGKLVHSFVLPEERNGVSNYGEYDVFIKPEGEEMLKGDFAYATDEDIDKLMSALKATDADFNAIFAPQSQWRTALKAIGCMMSEYDAHDDSASVAGLFLKAFTASADEAEVKRIFNAAVLISSIKDKDSAAKALESYSPEFEGKMFYESEPELKNWISEQVSVGIPFVSVSDFEAKYNKINALYAINNAKFDKLADVLEKYEAILEISSDSNYKAYSALSEANKNYANEELAVLLKNTPAASTESLSGALKTAVTAAAGVGGGGGNGGGGASGGSSKGSSSGGSMITSGPSVIEATDKPDSINGDFSDIDDAAWAKDAITALREKGIVSGKGDGKFCPHDSVTREEFTTMVVKAAGLYQPGEKAEFDDISSDDWCSSYVASAFNNKIICGISENIFGKGSMISRQDMAVIAYRAAKDNGRIHYGREMIEFKDADEISDYAKDAVEILYKASMINGNEGFFYPQNTATRAEAAIVIYNLFIK